ncbi:bifunctional RNase H/acid phosphatase [Cellulosimicrobium cellulans]|uniref:bifunctional RNase H/acid phosphatase n=1 Tax=Cellulosimicrobium cellulans TaxID=1710 RepID=UPI002405F6CE|nr:bifunctional RNase H/acid phosphatase [Cellulosimicrobium cellulans]MDF9877716.1 broad specificity phosphatase PhoE/ribonuclease HI [Cellulosimicrobium cellulans]
MSADGRRHLVVEADGGSRGNPGPAGFGALVRDGESGQVLAERAAFLGVTTNNVAEYSGLVAGLRAAAEIDPDARVTVRMDSRLVVEQMSGRWQIKHDAMRRLAAEAAAVLPAEQVAYEWVPRAQNSAADALANEAMDTAGTVSRDYALGADAVPGPGDDEPDLDAADAPEDVPGESAAFDTPARPSGAAVRFDDAPALTVVLVRHGQTPLTVAGAFSGSSVPGPSLTARGRTQAAQAADLVFRVGRQAWPDLPRPTTIVASPMVRAQETARAVGRRLGVHVTTDDRFAEVDFGEWEGRTAAEVDAAWPGLLHAWHTTGTTAAPGGESYTDVGARVWHGLQHLVETLLPGAGPGGRTAVVVGHAVQVRAAIGTAIGAPPSQWSRVRVPPASLSILRLWADGTSELTAQGVPSDL